MKVLALDYGSARTGIAVSDPTGTARAAARRRRAGRRRPPGFERLIDVIAVEAPERIVVGLPLTLRGEHGEQARETPEFVEALRGAVTFPVATYDERFTSSLAGGDDARAAAHLLSSYLEWSAPLTPRARVIRAGGSSRRSSSSSDRRRRGGRRRLGGVTTRDARRRRRDDRAAAASEAVPHRLPRGLHPAQMAQRVVAVAKIARRKRHGRVRLKPHGVPAPRARRGRPVLRHEAADEPRGVPLPGHIRLLQGHDLAAARADQIETFCRNWRKVDMRYARSKNLTPYDVLTIASMVEREAKAPAERKLIAAVIYNRLHQQMALGIDATLRYGLDIPPTESITRVAAAELHRRTTRATGRACRRRRSRTRASPRSRRPRIRRRWTTSTSRASRITCTTSSPRARDGFDPVPRRERLRSDTRHVALLGHPVSHSLSPLMQNAAFAAGGLDWHYSAFDVEDAVERGARRSRRSASRART